MDNLKKKKLDGKRVALKQPWEVKYVKGRAKKLLAILNKAKGRSLIIQTSKDKLEFFAVSSTKKICQALIKCL